MTSNDWWFRTLSTSTRYESLLAIGGFQTHRVLLSHDRLLFPTTTIWLFPFLDGHVSHFRWTYFSFNFLCKYKTKPVYSFFSYHFGLFTSWYIILDLSIILFPYIYMVILVGSFSSVYTIFFWEDKTRGNLIDTLSWLELESTDILCRQTWDRSRTWQKCVCRRKWYIGNTPECTIDRDTHKDGEGKFTHACTGRYDWIIVSSSLAFT